MEAEQLAIPDVWALTPKRFGDHRGFFSEVYNEQTLAAVGITDRFVQDNHSLSADVGTIRGLHFQTPPHAIAKLVRVTRGRVLDVVVDIRHGSPSFGEHVAIELSADNWKQIYVPIGFAHGFCTLEPDTEVAYKVTGHWHPESDKGIRFDDPALGVDWGVSSDDAILSDKDRAQPKLADLPSYFEIGAT